MIGQRCVATFAALVSCFAVQQAGAADLPSQLRAPAFVAPPVFSWTGAYIGAFVGGGAGTADFTNPRGSAIYGGVVHPSVVEGGGEIGFNVTLPQSRVVVGIEADGGAVGLNGTDTCVAYSGKVAPYNCRVDGRAMATGTARLGYAFGPEGRTLGYVKGGVAALFEERDLSTNASEVAKAFGYSNQPGATFDQRPQVGFTVGAGIERALSNAWSIKIEYDYADLGSSGLASPGTFRTSRAGFRLIPVSNPTTSFRQDLHMLKVGLNYHIGAAPGSSASSDFFGPPILPAATGTPAYGFKQGYTAELGGRYWYSFGRVQGDLGNRGQPNNSLISRLSYESRSSTGELFGRFDTSSRVFLKGFIGLGGSNGGHGNDEDFLVQQGRRVDAAYSNTLELNKNDLQYATVDLGYSILESAWAKVGGFVGYNHYRDANNATGCAQIAGQSGICVPTIPATGRPILTQNEQFNSLRVGVNGDIWIDRVRVQADAAYLPFVGFNGTDIHHNRTDVPTPVSPEFGRGKGVQLELIVSYYLTPNLSVGAGGRYWGFMVPNATTDDFGLGIYPHGVSAERYGVMAQLGYRFSSVAPETVVARY